ncbi:metallophosphoesterase [Aminobacter ciceronei]|uniref:3',5'-cyclic AMP phosphodiesterase CpdA n=1 Tax=Aminobacter ciceronei TaxID=150723 RepID=A0ABR6C9U0_9HYPH|nr:metallophosphoesterase [Aminobacter ciceronei]MBA8908012.1 3',5'-cyclic AMP phosphodiesterase CpdA [Aminobacter ciceronei]MBA9021767.1 3',5'-cyclic AMP phosphodiesterase CpdA [Aminobacter ciceronei]
MNSTSATFLHVTDAHIAYAGTALERDDRKTVVAGLQPQTREAALRQVFERLAERLSLEGRSLDGVIFSGDAQDRGRQGGHELLLDLLLSFFGPLGITAGRIVATPGNHDVDRAYDPGTAERYKDFCATWRARGCVVPWLDGVDDAGSTAPHSLIGTGNDWAIFPINSSNWCHAAAVLPEPLASVWAQLPHLASGSDTEKEGKLRHQLDALARYDMARISEHQLEQVRRLVDRTPRPEHGRQLRIAVLHHHLRAPSLREEIKAFSDISNLEQVRAFLRDREFDVVIHGHKHEHATQFDHVYDHAGDSARRLLVVSGATFEAGRESDAVCLLTFEGLPYTPSIRVEPIPLQRGGVDTAVAPGTTRRLWATPSLPNGPTSIQGSEIDEVYERVVAVAGAEAEGNTLIVHLDLPATDVDSLPLPAGYPMAEPLDPDARQDWLRELVGWWQLGRSKLEQRMPFVHGSRLRRFGGKIDQIDRIKKLLELKASTRALAVLVDPFRDFTADGSNEEFASFSLVEFKRRSLSNGRHAVEVIAFYRAQEFARWWPINVAELRSLQLEVCRHLNFAPGRITTIAADARTHSRSPTQVAMPIVDRWLDQAPERLHALANALVQRGPRGEKERLAVEGWRRCLAELEDVANNYNPDGVPVAVEGLEVLASYMQINVDDDTELGHFVRELTRLAEDNRGFENGVRDRAAFDTWSRRTLLSIADLRALTARRLAAA